MAASASIADLKSVLDQNIYTNQSNAITGDGLNAQLDNIVDTVDALKTDKMVLTATAFSFSGENSTASITISSTEVKKLFDYIAATGEPIQEFILYVPDDPQALLLVGDEYIGFSLRQYHHLQSLHSLTYTNINEEIKTGATYRVLINLSFSHNTTGTNYTTSINCVNVPFKLAQLNDDATHRLVTDSEKTAWSAKYDKPSGGIPESDLASAVTDKLNATEIFWATYGTTTADEILAAFDAGKAVMCLYQDNEYVLVRVIRAANPLQSNSALFSTGGGGSIKYFTVIGSNWGNISDASAEIQSNKVTSWSSTPNNNRYPSEKLVKDGLDAKQAVIDSSHKLDYSLLDNTPTIPTVPTISTDIATDGSDDTKTASPKAVKTYVDGGIEELAARITLNGAAQDLSYFDVNGIGTILRNTANTYVVRGTGVYKFPLVYGNGIKNGLANSQAYTRQGTSYTADFVNHLGNTLTSPYIEQNTGCTAASAGLLWQTGTSLITSVSLVQGSDCKYIQFVVGSIPATNGLAVLWVKDGNGDIMWSWTIWLTADDLTPETYTNHTEVEYDMMPENLGTIWNSDKTKCVSPFYQWGRKDALGIASAYNSATMMTVYDIDGNDVTLGNYGVAGDSDQGGTVRSVANAIKMPDKFFLPYDSTNYNWNNLGWFNNFWNAAITTEANRDDNQSTAIKTIYDPCPMGYMLPAGRFATGFTTTGSQESDSSKYNVVGSFDSGWMFKKDANDAVGSYWYAAGYRNYTNGTLGSVASRGLYWSFAVYSQLAAYGLDFVTNYINPALGAMRSFGISVRPVRELT